MTKDTISRLRRIYGAVLGVSIAAAGLCLMAACFGIYRSGDQAFSREAVAAAFRPIALPVYLCLALVLGGFLLHLVFPPEAKKPAAGKQDLLTLQRLHDKTDLSQCGEPLLSAITEEQKRRKRRSSIRTGLLALSSVIFLAYILSGDRFLLPDINSSMIRAMTVLLPCLAVTFGYAVFAAYRNAASVKKEIGLMKQANAAAPRKPDPKPAPVNQDVKLKRIRGAVLLLAAALLVYGFLSGGAADVLTKAINICTECVGLG